MALVMISIGTPSRSGVRTVPAQVVAAVAVVCGGLLLGAGIALGMAFAPHEAAPQPGPSGEAGSSASAEVQAPHAFTLEQVGALSARLFKLESEASELGRRLGVLPPDAAASAPRRRKAAGTGGPMLPPRPESALPSPLGALAERLGDIESRLEELGEQSALQQLRLMTLPSRLPVLGAAIGSAFGNRVDPLTGRKAFHAGLDFPAEYGSPILASAGGRVVFAGVRPDYGWTVEIAHGDGLVTRYAHASKLFVRTGDIVAPGERIALVGSTGRSTGPHLHYEVLRNGEHKDPRRFIAGL